MESKAQILNKFGMDSNIGIFKSRMTISIRRLFISGLLILVMSQCSGRNGKEISTDELIASHISGRVLEVYPYDREWWRISIVSDGIGYYFSTKNIWKVANLNDTAGHECWKYDKQVYCKQVDFWKLPGDSITKGTGDNYFRYRDKKIFIEK